MGYLDEITRIFYFDQTTIEDKRLSCLIIHLFTAGNLLLARSKMCLASLKHIVKFLALSQILVHLSAEKDVESIIV